MTTPPPDRPGQLAFDLGAATAYRREDFFPSPANAAALAALDDPVQRHHLLIGPHGAGKTHLAHLWAESHDARLIRPADLTALLPDLPPDAALAIDNADAGPLDQAALFHLYNRLAPQGRLLLTAATPPRDWGLTLPDLLSRLQTLPQLHLSPPDDALLSAVLVKLFADRQVAVSPALITWLLARMERSIAAARQTVTRLDAEALARGRPITRALAAEVLGAAPQAGLSPP